MRPEALRWFLPLALLLSTGCATTGGPKAIPESATETGTASFYSHSFIGRRTASGTTYDENELTAAHRTLPFGTRVRVTNLRNNRNVVVTVTDRGPSNSHRLIDVSRRAADILGFVEHGTAHVHLEVVPGP
jgi:rare lipoprotein A